VSRLRNHHGLAPTCGVNGATGCREPEVYGEVGSTVNSGNCRTITRESRVRGALVIAFQTDFPLISMCTLPSIATLLLGARFARSLRMNSSSFALYTWDAEEEIHIGKTTGFFYVWVMGSCDPLEAPF